MRTNRRKRARNVLVVDVGGTHIKVLATGEKEPRNVLSGPSMTPSKLVREVKRAVKEWKFDAVAIGYPGLVIHGHPLGDPHNPGHEMGWI